MRSAPASRDFARPSLLSSALVMVATIAAIGLVIFALQPLPLIDLRASLDSAAGWQHGLDPYVTAIHDATGGSRSGSGYAYPPYLLPFFAGLQQLGVQAAAAFWQLVQLAALSYLVWSLAWPRSPRRVAALVILAVGFYPVITNLVLGQVGLMTAGLLWAGLRLRDEGRPQAAGVIVAVASFVKLFPLLTLAALLRRRRHWATGLFAVATMVAVVVASIPWVGGLWPEYLGRVLFEKAASPTTFPDAQSIVAATLRAMPSAGATAHLAGTALSAAVLVAVLAVAWRLDGTNARLAWALVLAALPMILPYAWQHYYVLALPLLWLVGSAGVRRRDPWLLLGGIVAYLCLSVVALTIDYWESSIIARLGWLGGLYLNSSVLGGAALLIAGSRLAALDGRSGDVPVRQTVTEAAA